VTTTGGIRAVPPLVFTQPMKGKDKDDGKK